MQKIIIKIISIIIIAAFLAQDVVWANPEIFSRESAKATLQIPLMNGSLNSNLLEDRLRIKLEEIRIGLKNSPIEHFDFPLNLPDEDGNRYEISFPGTLIADPDSPSTDKTQLIISCWITKKGAKIPYKVEAKLDLKNKDEGFTVTRVGEIKKSTKANPPPTLQPEPVKQEAPSPAAGSEHGAIIKGIDKYEVVREAEEKGSDLDRSKLKDVFDILAQIPNTDTLSAEERLTQVAIFSGIAKEKMLEAIKMAREDLVDNKKRLVAFPAIIRDKDRFGLGIGTEEFLGYSQELVYTLEPELNAEFLFHEALCYHLTRQLGERGHDISRQIQMILFPANYENLTYEERQAAKGTDAYTGKLTIALRQFIDKSFEADQAEALRIKAKAGKSEAPTPKSRWRIFKIAAAGLVIIGLLIAGTSSVIKLFHWDKQSSLLEKDLAPLFNGDDLLTLVTIKKLHDRGSDNTIVCLLNHISALSLDRDGKIKAEAIKTLGTNNGPTVTAKLYEILKDRNQPKIVREAALDALKGDPDLEKFLIKLLADYMDIDDWYGGTKTKLRGADLVALKGLKGTKDPEALAELRKALKICVHEESRDLTIRAFSGTEDPKDVDTLLKILILSAEGKVSIRGDEKLSVIETLKEIKIPAAKVALTKIAADRSYSQIICQKAVMSLIGDESDEAIDVLCEYLKAGSFYNDELPIVMNALKLIKKEKVMNALLNTASASCGDRFNRSTRSDAAFEALIKMQDDYSINFLLKTLQLKSGDQSLNYVAAYVLKKTDSAYAIDELLKLTGKKIEATTRLPAIKALNPAKDPRAAQRIVELITDKHEYSEARKAAIEASYDTSHPSVIEALIKVVNEEGQGLDVDAYLLRLSAVETLAQIDHPLAKETVMKILNGKDDGLRAKALVYAKYRPQLIELALRILMDKEDGNNGTLVDSALQTFGRTKDPALIKRLAAILANPNEAWYVRRNIGGALRNMACDKTRDMILEALGTKDRGVNNDIVGNSIADAMFAGQNSQIILDFLDDISTAGEWLQYVEIKALRGKSDPVIIDKCLKILETNKNPVLMRYAAIVLAGNPQAAEALIRIAGDGSRDNIMSYVMLRLAAVKALKGIENPAAKTLLIKLTYENKNNNLRRAAISALNPTENMARLLELWTEFTSPANRERLFDWPGMEVVNSLKYIEKREAVDAIVGYVTKKGGDWLTKENISKALQGVKNPMLSAALIQAAQDKNVDSHDRGCAVTALKGCKDPDIKKSLLKLLDEKPPADICLSCLEVLAGDKNLEFLLTIIKNLDSYKHPSFHPDEDHAIWAQALKTATDLEDDRAVDALTKALETQDQGVPDLIVEVLGGKDSYRAKQALLQALAAATNKSNKVNVTTKMNLIATIGLLGSGDFTRPLLAILNDPNEDFWARRDAIRALSSIKDPEVTQVFEKMISDDNCPGEFRSEAAKALLKSADKQDAKILRMLLKFAPKMEEPEQKSLRDTLMKMDKPLVRMMLFTELGRSISNTDLNSLKFFLSFGASVGAWGDEVADAMDIPHGTFVDFVKGLDKGEAQNFLKGYIYALLVRYPDYKLPTANEPEASRRIADNLLHALRFGYLNQNYNRTIAYFLENVDFPDSLRYNLELNFKFSQNKVITAFITLALTTPIAIIPFMLNLFSRIRQYARLRGKATLHAAFGRAVTDTWRFVNPKKHGMHWLAINVTSATPFALMVYGLLAGIPIPGISLAPFASIALAGWVHIVLSGRIFNYINDDLYAKEALSRIIAGSNDPLDVDTVLHDPNNPAKIAALDSYQKERWQKALDEYPGEKTGELAPSQEKASSNTKHSRKPADILRSISETSGNGKPGNGASTAPTEGDKPQAPREPSKDVGGPNASPEEVNDVIRSYIKAGRVVKIDLSTGKFYSPRYIDSFDPERDRDRERFDRSVIPILTATQLERLKRYFKNPNSNTIGILRDTPVVNLKDFDSGSLVHTGYSTGTIWFGELLLKDILDNEWDEDARDIIAHDEKHITNPDTAILEHDTKEYRSLYMRVAGRAARLLAESILGKPGREVMESGQHLEGYKSRAFACMSFLGDTRVPKGYRLAMCGELIGITHLYPEYSANIIDILEKRLRKETVNYEEDFALFHSLSVIATENLGNIRPSTIQVFERWAREPGLPNDAYYAAWDALRRIAEKKTEFIGPTTFTMIEDIIRTSGLNPAAYCWAVQIVGLCAKSKDIQPSMIQALKDLLAGRQTDVRVYEDTAHALLYIASYNPDRGSEIMQALEEIANEPGHYDISYGYAANVIGGIARDLPKLVRRSTIEALRNLFKLRMSDQAQKVHTIAIGALCQISLINEEFKRQAEEAILEFVNQGTDNGYTPNDQSYDGVFSPPARLKELADKLDPASDIAIAKHIKDLFEMTKIVDPEVLKDLKLAVVADNLMDNLGLNGRAYGLGNRIFIRKSKFDAQQNLTSQDGTLTEFGRIIIHETVARHLAILQKAAKGQGSVHHWAARNLEQQLEMAALVSLREGAKDANERARLDAKINRLRKYHQKELSRIEAQIKASDELAAAGELQPVEDNAMEWLSTADGQAIYAINEALIKISGRPNGIATLKEFFKILEKAAGFGMTPPPLIEEYRQFYNEKLNFPLGSTEYNLFNPNFQENIRKLARLFSRSGPGYSRFIDKMGILGTAFERPLTPANETTRVAAPPQTRTAPATPPAPPRPSQQVAISELEQSMIDKYIGRLTAYLQNLRWINDAQASWVLKHLAYLREVHEAEAQSRNIDMAISRNNDEALRALGNYGEGQIFNLNIPVYGETKNALLKRAITLLDQKIADFSNRQKRQQEQDKIDREKREKEAAEKYIRNLTEFLGRIQWRDNWHGSQVMDLLIQLRVREFSTLPEDLSAIAEHYNPEQKAIFINQLADGKRLDEMRETASQLLDKKISELKASEAGWNAQETSLKQGNAISQQDRGSTWFRHINNIPYSILMHKINGVSLLDAVKKAYEKGGFIIAPENMTITLSKFTPTNDVIKLEELIQICNGMADYLASLPQEIVEFVMGESGHRLPIFIRAAKYERGMLGQLKLQGINVKDNDVDVERPDSITIWRYPRDRRESVYKPQEIFNHEFFGHAVVFEVLRRGLIDKLVLPRELLAYLTSSYGNLNVYSAGRKTIKLKMITKDGTTRVDEFSINDFDTNNHDELMALMGRIIVLATKENAEKEFDLYHHSVREVVAREMEEHGYLFGKPFLAIPDPHAVGKFLYYRITPPDANQCLKFERVPEYEFNIGAGRTINQFNISLLDIDSRNRTKGGPGASSAIGKFIEDKENPVGVNAEGRLTGIIEHIDTKDLIDLAKINQRRAPPEEVNRLINNARTVVSSLPDSPAKSFLEGAVKHFSEHLPEHVVIIREAKRGFFGMARPGLLIIDEGISDNGLSCLHEILEYVKNYQPQMLKDIKKLLNEDSQAWLARHEAHYQRNGRAQYFADNLGHYVIRALTRQAFGQKDKELSSRIKARQIDGTAVSAFDAELVKKSRAQDPAEAKKEWGLYRIEYLADGGRCRFGHFIRWRLTFKNSVTGELITDLGSEEVTDTLGLTTTDRVEQFKKDRKKWLDRLAVLQRFRVFLPPDDAQALGALANTAVSLALPEGEKVDAIFARLEPTINEYRAIEEALPLLDRPRLVEKYLKFEQIGIFQSVRQKLSGDVIQAPLSERERDTVLEVRAHLESTQSFLPSTRRLWAHRNAQAANELNKDLYVVENASLSNCYLAQKYIDRLRNGNFRVIDFGAGRSAFYTKVIELLGGAPLPATSTIIDVDVAGSGISEGSNPNKTIINGEGDVVSAEPEDLAREHYDQHKRNGTYDLIVSNFSLPHLTSLQIKNFLLMSFKLLAKDGELVISLPRNINPSEGFMKSLEQIGWLVALDKKAKMRISPEEFRNIVKKDGLRVARDLKALVERDFHVLVLKKGREYFDHSSSSIDSGLFTLEKAHIQRGSSDTQPVAGRTALNFDHISAMHILADGLNFKDLIPEDSAPGSYLTGDSRDLDSVIPRWPDIEPSKRSADFDKKMREAYLPQLEKAFERFRSCGARKENDTIPEEIGRAFIKDLNEFMKALGMTDDEIDKFFPEWVKAAPPQAQTLNFWECVASDTLNVLNGNILMDRGWFLGAFLSGPHPLILKAGIVHHFNVVEIGRYALNFAVVTDYYTNIEQRQFVSSTLTFSNRGYVLFAHEYYEDTGEGSGAKNNWDHLCSNIVGNEAEIVSRTFLTLEYEGRLRDQNHARRPKTAAQLQAEVKAIINDIEQKPKSVRAIGGAVKRLGFDAYNRARQEVAMQQAWKMFKSSLQIEDALRADPNLSLQQEADIIFADVPRHAITVKLRDWLMKEAERGSDASRCKRDLLSGAAQVRTLLLAPAYEHFIVQLYELLDNGVTTRSFHIKLRNHHLAEVDTEPEPSNARMSRMIAYLIEQFMAGNIKRAQLTDAENVMELHNIERCNTKELYRMLHEGVKDAPLFGRNPPSGNKPPSAIGKFLETSPVGVDAKGRLTGTAEHTETGQSNIINPQEPVPAPKPEAKAGEADTNAKPVFVQEERGMLDILKPDELVRNLIGNMISMSLSRKYGKRVVLAFHKGIVEERGSPLDRNRKSALAMLLRKLKDLKKNKEFESILANMEIIESYDSPQSLSETLKDMKIDCNDKGNAIFTFSASDPKDRKPVSIGTAVRSVLVEKGDFDRGRAYYPLAEMVTITLIKYLQEPDGTVLDENAIIEMLAAHSITEDELKMKLNIDKIATPDSAYIIFTLVPNASPINISDRHDRYRLISDKIMAAA